ncbi:MAG: XTP/dITP diphosphatase [Bacillaceae bacterium]
MKKIVVATKNKGKVRDFQGLFSKYGYEVVSLFDFPNLEDVEETGTTFEENAILKAETISKQIGEIVLADDSGLIVDMLDGRPGVYSARYAGEQKDDEANIDKVLGELADVTDDNRTARFYCALALARPNQQTIVVHGTCEGRIAHERKGDYGFGYDPVFYIVEQGKTMAELSPEQKNKISHRSNALKKLDEALKEVLF